MTPAQLEHLKLLDAHLDILLETAKKRTPGRWKVILSNNATPHLYTDDGSWHDGPSGEFVAVMPAEISRSYNSFSNADFIASCASNAEAGWKVTQRQLRTWLGINKTTQSEMLCELSEITLRDILSAWPLELITKHQ